jgi:molybdopterin molybdotransferase
VFGPDNLGAVLGAFTLEALRLSVDPINRRLIPTPTLPFLMASAYEMIPVEDAMAMIRGVVRPLPEETVPTAEADGRILARDLSSPEDVPAFRASTVDGFAVIAEDLDPSRNVASQIMAGGASAPSLTPGNAARIMTGAPVPDGANAVVMIEDTTMDDRRVVLQRSVGPGDNIRPIGIDVARGERILTAGTALDSTDIGLLMTLGYTEVPCFRRPTVAVLSTGDELVEPGEPLPFGGIRDSNRYALLAAIREAGAVPLSLGKARDDRELQTRLVRDGVDRADVLITSGGVSVGDRDYIKPALAELGKVHFGRINFRPGMPLTFAEIGPKLAFGLPGNPVSSLVTFEVFVRPTLRRLQGDRNPERPRVEVELEHELGGPGSRVEYHRAIVRWSEGRLVGRSTGLQLSSRLMSMVGHNALLILEQGSAPIPAGTRLPALLTGPILSE